MVITLGAIYQTWLHVGPPGQQKRAELMGDGQNVPSYGFDLSQLAEGINPNEIHATPNRRGEVPVLTVPGEITVAENSEQTGHDKYVLPTDRVIGVKSFYSHARAYPVQIMQVHQLVNDKLPDTEPANISYDPLAECVRVFSSSGGGHTNYWDLYGVSGLSYKGQSLLYRSGWGNVDEYGQHIEEANAEEDQILYWPLAQTSLNPKADGTYATDLPLFGEVYVLQWRDWVERFPDTTIVRRRDEYKEQYKRDIYGPYYQSMELPSPVVPQLSPARLSELGLSNKSRGMGIKGLRGGHVFIPYSSILKNATFTGEGPGRWSYQIHSVKLEFECRPADVGFTPETAWVLNQADLHYHHDLDVIPMCFLYAWYATHPTTFLVKEDGTLEQPTPK